MPSDDLYASAAGGALKLKGGSAKVKKHKKKSRKKRPGGSGLEKALSTGGTRGEEDEEEEHGGNAASEREGGGDRAVTERREGKWDHQDGEGNKGRKATGSGADEERGEPRARSHLTEAEQRFEEARMKRVSPGCCLIFSHFHTMPPTSRILGIRLLCREDGYPIREQEHLMASFQR